MTEYYVGETQIGSLHHIACTLGEAQHATGGGEWKIHCCQPESVDNTSVNPSHPLC